MMVQTTNNIETQFKTIVNSSDALFGLANPLVSIKESINNHLLENLTSKMDNINSSIILITSTFRSEDFDMSLDKITELNIVVSMLSKINEDMLKPSLVDLTTSSDQERRYVYQLRKYIGLWDNFTDAMDEKIEPHFSALASESAFGELWGLEENNIWDNGEWETV